MIDPFFNATISKDQLRIEMLANSLKGKANMKKCTLCVWLVVLSISSSVFGWSSNAHQGLTANIFTDPEISSFLTEFGIDRNAVINGSDDLDTDKNNSQWEQFHSGQWTTFATRQYVENLNGLSKWYTTSGMDETRRLKYLMHNVMDVGVPLGHSPAREVYVDTVTEAILEFQAEFWNPYPGPPSVTYSGTISQIMTQFHDDCVANAAWFKAGGNSTTAGWQGMLISQKLAKAFLTDYFLSKRNVVAAISGTYGVNPGGSATLSSAGSYDPDSITWNTNATYYNNGGGIVAYNWDLNNDGVYGDVAGASVGLSYQQLYNIIGPTEGRTIKLQVVDDEGKVNYASSTVAVYTNPTANGRSQNGWLGKTGDVPSGRNVDNLIDNGSVDLDGGSIVEYAWDLNNNGTYDKFGGSSLQVTYDDFSSLGVQPNENHTVTLRVTDNEGVTSVQSGIRMPILVNPTADAGPDANVTRSGSILLSATGFDPDGGAITAWQWDLNGDGVYGDATGQNLTFSYDQLIALGVQPGIKNTVSLRVVDNDGTITGGNWQGTASDSMILGMIPSSLQGDTDCNNIVNYADFITFKNNFGKPGTWFHGDFDLNGIVDYSDFVSLKANFGRSVQGVPEPLTVGFLALGTLLVGRMNRKKA